MKEIKIQNSNLFLKVVDIGGANEYNLGSDKSKLRYQYVLVENTKTGKLSPDFPYGSKKVHLYNNDPKKLYLLVKNKKKFGKDIQLTEDEKISVLKFLKDFIVQYPLECEPLVYSIRNKKLVEEYQSCFGSAIKGKFIPFLDKLINDPQLLIDEGNCDDFFLKDYKRRYSIIDLLDELKEDPKSKIKLIPDILNYNRVSPKITDISKNIVEYLDTPGEILSISKSKSKFNINITYKSFVKITAPSGNVYDDFSCLKNFCVIKEGKLNTKYICVEINSKIAKKLKRLGVIYTKLNQDTYILDLSKLPIYSRGNIGIVLPWMLEKYEYEYQCSKFKEEYIKYLMEKNGVSKKEVPEIDIVNKIYTPKQLSRSSNGSYMATHYETEITDTIFPKNSVKRKILFNNRNSIIDSTPKNIIKEVDDLAKTETLENLLSRTKIEVKKSSEMLSNSKFKLILTKSCKFYTGTGRDAYGRITPLKGKYGEIKLMWNIKEQKVYTYEKRESIN